MGACGSSTCDGTGEVHSHNPKCWDCHGTGWTDREIAIREIRRSVIPQARLVMEMSGTPFGEDEERLVIEFHLVER